MTPRELIEMLNGWKLDDPFEVRVLNPNPGHPQPSIILEQEFDSINISNED